MNTEHHFAVRVEWQGDLGSGTSSFRDYSRRHAVTAEGVDPIAGSSARVFHGDAARWNPEQLLIASLSQCHMLSYLHAATARGVVVVAYTDAATGTLQQSGQGGRMTDVTLRPVVTISSADEDLALSLHGQAAANCFIAASVSVPVRVEPTIVVAT